MSLLNNSPRKAFEIRRRSRKIDGARSGAALIISSMGLRALSYCRRTSFRRFVVFFFLLNCFVESVQLLNVELWIEWLVELNKFLTAYVFIEINWSTCVWCILEVKILILKGEKPMGCGILRHCPLSRHRTNLMSSFAGLNISIKNRQQMVSKILSYVHLNFHFNVMKGHKN